MWEETKFLNIIILLVKTDKTLHERFSVLKLETRKAHNETKRSLAETPPFHLSFPLKNRKTMNPRYIQNDSSIPLKKEPNPNGELRQSLDKIVQNYRPRKDWAHVKLHGLYSGPTSIAYLFLHLSRSHPATRIQGETPAHWCKAYLSGHNHMPASVSPDNCGVINEKLSWYAVAAALTRDECYVEELRGLAMEIAGAPGGSDEWLYGRAGLLYLLRLVRCWVPSSTERMEPCMRRVIVGMMKRGRPWKWHGKEYLGAVHGGIGIITQILLCEPEYRLDAGLCGYRAFLESQQDPETGNWPSSVGSSKELVQFCHGAPGFVISLEPIKHLFEPGPQEKIERILEKARDCIWEKGILTKEPNLCHGATGNALALKGQQREHLLAYTTAQNIEKGLDEGWFVEGSDRWGLFTGEAGRAWGWLVADLGKEMGMIGYSDV